LINKDGELKGGISDVSLLYPHQKLIYHFKLTTKN